jgi:hypothetical protein
MCGQIHILRKKKCYPLNRKLSGRQSQTGHFGEERNHLHLLWFKHQSVQPVNWRLYRLQYPGSPQSPNVTRNSKHTLMNCGVACCHYYFLKVWFTSWDTKFSRWWLCRSLWSCVVLYVSNDISEIPATFIVRVPNDRDKSFLFYVSNIWDKLQE